MLNRLPLKSKFTGFGAIREFVVRHTANKFNLVGNKEFCDYLELLSADGAGRPSIALDVPHLLSSGLHSWRTLLQPLLAAYRY